VTWCGSVMTSAGEEVAPRRGKEGDNTSWSDVNFTGLIMNKIHVVDSADTNK
jgi:hypothetical protein